MSSGKVAGPGSKVHCQADVPGHRLLARQADKWLHTNILNILVCKIPEHQETNKVVTAPTTHAQSQAQVIEGFIFYSLMRMNWEKARGVGHSKIAQTPQTGD